MDAMRDSHRPFWKQTITPPSDSAGRAARAASSTCGGWVASSTTSNRSPAGTPSSMRPRTVRRRPSPVVRMPCSRTAL
jgi:hypothetical protein